jgi:hypothetical protein
MELKKNNFPLNKFKKSYFFNKTSCQSIINYLILLFLLKNRLLTESISYLFRELRKYKIPLTPVVELVETMG